MASSGSMLMRLSVMPSTSANALTYRLVVSRKAGAMKTMWRISGGMELDVRGRGERHVLGRVPVRMTHVDEAVGEQRLLPVAARRAGTEQRVVDDVRPEP